MFTLTKEFRFEAAHSLPQLPASHKCHHLHGHSYRVELELRAEEMDANGFAGGVDYADLDKFGDVIDATLDHQNLNEVKAIQDALGEGAGPTAEFLAWWLHGLATGWWPDLVAAVRVYETAKTCVEYRP
jgi:6-pyruvoyltetrahydropterin/6-carboxytetrahydropterin synthase